MGCAYTCVCRSSTRPKYFVTCISNTCNDMCSSFDPPRGAVMFRDILPILDSRRRLAQFHIGAKPTLDASILTEGCGPTWGTLHEVRCMHEKQLFPFIEITHTHTHTHAHTHTYAISLGLWTKHAPWHTALMCLTPHTTYVQTARFLQQGILEQSTVEIPKVCYDSALRVLKKKSRKVRLPHTHTHTHTHTHIF